MLLGFFPCNFLQVFSFTPGNFYVALSFRSGVFLLDSVAFRIVHSARTHFVHSSVKFSRIFSATSDGTVQFKTEYKNTNLPERHRNAFIREKKDVICGELEFYLRERDEMDRALRRRDPGEEERPQKGRKENETESHFLTIFNSLQFFICKFCIQAQTLIHKVKFSTL